LVVAAADAGGVVADAADAEPVEGGANIGSLVEFAELVAFEIGWTE
jgi:hypothetical protein